jgi:Alternative oxidase
VCALLRPCAASCTTCNAKQALGQSAYGSRWRCWSASVSSGPFPHSPTALCSQRAERAVRCAPSMEARRPCASTAAAAKPLARPHPQVHFAEEWNELHHLQIMEALGGDQLWLDRFLAYHAAVVYYWVLIVFYLFAPELAYNFSELIEASRSAGCAVGANGRTDKMTDR